MEIFSKAFTAKNASVKNYQQRRIITLHKIYTIVSSNKDKPCLILWSLFSDAMQNCSIAWVMIDCSICVRMLCTWRARLFLKLDRGHMRSR